MNYLAHLKLAQDAIEQGLLFEATRQMCYAADAVDAEDPKYQRGKDAVAALHSKLERLIGNLEDVQTRLVNEVIPKWEQVHDNNQPRPPPLESDLSRPVLKPLSELRNRLTAELLEGLDEVLPPTPEVDEDNEDQNNSLFTDDVLPDEELAEILGVIYGDE